MSFIARNLTPKIGTEIEASRASLLSGEHAAELRHLLEARGVLVFRGLHLTDAEQKEFAGTMGEVMSMGDEGIQKISLDKELNPTADYLRGAFYWHIDGSNDKVPTRALQQVAIDSGMKTMWRRGLDRVLTGKTTLEEIVRVISVDEL